MFLIKRLAILFFGICIALAASESYAQTHKVKRVIRSDLIELEMGEQVKLIGVTAPAKAGSFEAQLQAFDLSGERLEMLRQMGILYTESLINDQEIMLEYDFDRRDIFGNLLAYVWIPSQEMDNELLFLEPDYFQIRFKKQSQGERKTFVFLNAALLKAGLVEEESRAPNVRYTQLFRRMQKEAQTAERQLWE